jgi:hypothetical protein
VESDDAYKQHCRRKTGRETSCVCFRTHLAEALQEELHDVRIPEQRLYLRAYSHLVGRVAEGGNLLHDCCHAVRVVTQLLREDKTKKGEHGE